MVLTSEDLISLPASPLLHILKIFVLPTKIEKTKIMVQNFIRCLLGQFFSPSCMVLSMFKNWQLLIVENERKSKRRLVPQDFTEISPRTVLDVAFIFRNVSALKAGLFLLITDLYMHPASLFSMQHNIQVGLSNYPTYTTL